MFTILYKSAKRGEKGRIVQDVVTQLGLSENTAKIYLAKYLKGTLCKLS